MRPIGGPDDEAMVHRIVVDVVQVHLEVSLVDNEVLPIAALPHVALTLAAAADVV